jgi:diacylglycerol kinase family enzyme
MQESTPHHTPRAHLIANARSGKGLGATLPELAARIAKSFNIELIHYDTTSPGSFDSQVERAIAAAKADGGTIIAAGGDGTIRSVAQRAAEEQVLMGIVACGTFNFFARGHNIPEEIEAALTIALTGEERSVRLGQANKAYFLINASVGLYERTIREREKSTKIFGRNRLVVILSSMKTLLTQRREFDVEMVTGGTRTHLRTLSIFVGNNALQLRNLDMDVASCMKNDLLAVVVLKPVSRMEMLRIFVRGITKTLERDERLEMFCVDSLTIKMRKPKVRVALDGEILQMTTPLEIQSMPEILRLRLPAGKSA